MTARIVTHAEQPSLEERHREIVRSVWPEFMRHDPVCNEYWALLFARFPQFQCYLYDDGLDEVQGIGNTIPIAWDGTVEGLPAGVDGVLIEGFQQLERGILPTALSALQAAVAPGRQGQGLSRAIIDGMRDLAVQRGLVDLIAPVRPSMKSRYPLTPMEQYVQWQRDDGLPLDPWIRVHRRLDAEILRIAPRSMVITGTVTEWEAWTDLVFPESGPYVVPGALNPITIHRQRDEGRYEEPNVWMRHRLTTAAPGERC